MNRALETTGAACAVAGQTFKLLGFYLKNFLYRHQMVDTKRCVRILPIYASVQSQAGYASVQSQAGVPV